MTSFFSWFVWLLAIMFYFYEFFLRVLPATVSKSIMSSMHLSMEEFALLGSAYYLTYSLMQLPVGLLLDRFSAKILITIAAACCSLGALGFSLSTEFWLAFVSRLFIGFGSAFGFVSLMIVTLNWFPKKYFAFLVGCGQFLGAIGPLCAGAPIALMLKATHGDWRIIFLSVAIFGIALSVLIACFLQGKPKSDEKIIFMDIGFSLKERIKTLLRRPQIWFTLLYAGLIYVALPLLGAFWGVAYLEARGLEKATGALTISMLWIGLAVGSPLFGHLSDKVRRRKPFIALNAFIGLIASLIFILTPSLSVFYLGLLFFLIGLAGSGQNLSFALAQEHAPAELKATALGINNTAIMGFATIIPPLVTLIIKANTVGGQFTEAAFEKGFIVIPGCFLVALLVSLFAIKETFCREQNMVHQIPRA